MIKNIYLLLGLPETASWSEVQRTYAGLMDHLTNPEQNCQKDCSEAVNQLRDLLSESWEHMKKPDVRQVHCPQPADDPQKCYRPKLGQLLVAAGMLTLDELDSLLEIQRNSKTEHIPIGHLMVNSGYINEQQLHYYLHMQTVLKLPPDHPQRWGQRLLELGLVTDDQLKVALIEQKTTGCTLREALINRSWLSSQLLDRIF